MSVIKFLRGKWQGRAGQCFWATEQGLLMLVAGMVNLQLLPCLFVRDASLWPYPVADKQGSTNIGSHRGVLTPVLLNLLAMTHNCVAKSRTESVSGDFLFLWISARNEQGYSLFYRPVSHANFILPLDSARKAGKSPGSICVSCSRADGVARDGGWCKGVGVCAGRSFHSWHCLASQASLKTSVLHLVPGCSLFSSQKGQLASYGLKPISSLNVSSRPCLGVGAVHESFLYTGVQHNLWVICAYERPVPETPGSRCLSLRLFTSCCLSGTSQERNVFLAFKYLTVAWRFGG